MPKKARDLTEKLEIKYTEDAVKITLGLNGNI